MNSISSIATRGGFTSPRHASAAAEQADATRESDMGETKRVLVVEDDESIRECVQVVLEDEGYDVIEASDGAAALALLDTVWPDVILLDMLMPGMDGWAFAVAYRQRPGPHAPIVVITAARADQIDAEPRTAHAPDPDPGAAGAPARVWCAGAGVAARPRRDGAERPALAAARQRSAGRGQARRRTHGPTGGGCRPGAPAPPHGLALRGVGAGARHRVHGAGAAGAAGTDRSGEGTARRLQPPGQRLKIHAGGRTH